MIRWILCAAGVATLPAQPLSYGFKLGVPVVTDSSGSPYSTENQSRWSGGPSVEVHLPYRLSVEFATILRSSRENTVRPIQQGLTQHPYLLSSADKVQTWDFPLLMKYRFTEGRIRPYVGAGTAWSHRRSDFLALFSCLGPQGSCRPEEFPTELTGASQKSTLTKFGPAASTGLDIKTQHVTFSPEVRWNRAFSGGSTRDQFLIGLGISFGRQ